MSKNFNCLAGLRCPKCGNEDRLLIEALVTCSVTDDGAEPAGDMEWNEKSWCVCPRCDEEGELSKFRVEEEA